MIRLATKRSSAKTMVGLTSLVDVVFILLIFFMLASNFNDWRGIRMNLPPAGIGEVENQDPVRLRQEAGNRIFLADELLNSETLAIRLGIALGFQADRQIIIQVAPGVPLQDSIDLLDMIDRLGGRDATLVEFPDEEGER